MKMRFPWILPLLVGVNCFALGQTNIVINEFLASNVATNADIVDFAAFSDWIELYNGGNADVDIGGYALTDDPGKPGRWKFPAGTIIHAKGFLLVWADGYDEVPGKTHVRPYYPNDQFTTRYFHLNFKLDMAGEFVGLIGPDGMLRDSVTFGLQQSDVSRGRKPDGSPNWFYFGEPTPANSNTTEGLQNTQHAATPVVSPESGFLTGNQFVTVGPQPVGALIRYTLDGSRPTSLSPLYIDPVPISQTTVMRVRVFEQGKLPGPIVTRTYFINENVTVPVISISTNPELLWDQNSGIYTNSFKERELPVHFEFFEPGGSPGFNLDAALSLTGQLSLYYPQKSFTISSDNRFGTDIMEYRFFPQRALNTFTSLYLRNSGVPDNRSTLLRDALLHSLVINKMDLDCQAYRPSVVFLNGAYWGIYPLREKVNSSYLGTLHNLNPTDVDLLEYEGNVEPTLMEGQADNFHSFFSYISNNDLSRTDNYSYLQTWMDVDEFINYQICEIYCDNVVWLDENVRMWRERKDGARWRWVLFDTDFGFGMPSQMSKGYTNNTLRFATSSNTGDPVIAPLWSTLLFRKLLLNQEFKTKFIQRFASYLNSVFQPDSVIAVVNRMQLELSPGMPRHISRWRNGDYYYGYPIPDYPTWLGNVAVVKTFARNRPLFQRQHIIEYFGLGGTSAVSMDIVSPGSGRIVVNGIEKIHRSSSGTYFKGITTRLEAVPAIGYRFVRWEGIDSAYQNPVDVVVTQDSLHITALFQPVTINTVPAHISSDTTLTAGHSPY